LDSNSVPSPPDVDEWIRQNAAVLRNALMEPTTRARILDLLTGGDERRQRRLEEVAAELDGTEITMQLGKDDDGTA
jgi:hypothetical protein